MTRWTETEVVEHVQTLSVGDLRLWIREGWVMPSPGSPAATFDDADVARIRLICQLRDDLGLDGEAVAVALSLIDQIHGLRHELRALAAAIDAEPPPTRDRIRAAYRAKPRP